jgi:LAO/AO transport system kinase
VGNNRLNEIHAIAERVRTGDRLALARLITDIENGGGDYQQVLDLLYPGTGSAHIIGITGAPGSGKSTLVNCLARELKLGKDEKPARIAIIAVDPSSPFSGGALLGDRVRMQFHANDPDIFIRSMASRGALGGIANATDNVALAMDAAGYDPILIETVGAGQSEVEIASLAHTTIVVEAPGLGDDVQAAKAGLLEIADILVVNKSEKPAADTTVASLMHMLELGEEIKDKRLGLHWKIPLVKTSAIDCEGVGKLVEQIHAHYQFLHQSGAWEKCDLMRLSKQVNYLLRESLFADWQKQLDQKSYNDLMVQVMHHQISPHQAAQKLLNPKQ